jgi:hypothetical protein
MASAIPGGAPGYDDDKQFGNFVTHFAADTSQRLRDHSVKTPDVKGRRREAQTCSLHRFPHGRESVFGCKWSYPGKDPASTVLSRALACSGFTHSNSGNWCRNHVNCRLA